MVGFNGTLRKSVFFIAQKTVLDIIQAVDQLREFPALGRVGRVEGTRELVIPDRPFIVPY